MAKTGLDLVDAKSFRFSSGCPPGIRTPICCSRGSCPTIERGGNAVNKKPADSASFSILRAGVSLVNPSAPLCSSRGEEADSRKRLSGVSPVLNRPGAAAEEVHPAEDGRAGTQHALG